MQNNPMNTQLQQGQSVFGTMIRLVPDPGLVSLLANLGYDFILIDMEHSVFSLETVATLVRVARQQGLTAIVRPPVGEKPYMARLLDAGAQGLMIPMMETRDQAERIRDACFYRPLGLRGCATLLGQTDFINTPAPAQAEEANQSTLILAQIESKKGVENAEAILSVEGIEAAIIGPHDLSDSLGIVGQMNHPALIHAIQQVIHACRVMGKPCGIHAGDLEQVQYWSHQGMRILACSTDTHALYHYYKDLVDRFGGHRSQPEEKR
ncbi:MAG: aldolase/citrate lyase family protein [bacterium]|nr:aldolase/citrate lyase family protein [bacterium]